MENDTSLTQSFLGMTLIPHSYRMSEQVVFKKVISRECCTADVTRMWLLFSVSEEVSLEIVLSGECFFTDVASMRFFFGTSE